jgi:hypothetical protein
MFTLALSHDLSYKRNFSAGDVTRNLRNLRPSFELREQWSFTDQVRTTVLQSWYWAEEET